MMKRTLKSGFTMVELIVTIGIFMVLTSVVLSNYRNYDTNALFANASEDVVLALRQAQVYGVGVKRTSGSDFGKAYGVYFDIGNQIKIFADLNGNGTYQPADRLVETITWKSPIAITGLTCGFSACGGSGLSVTFLRPNPDAIINNSSVTSATIAMWNGVSGVGSKRSTTTISSTGQISFQ